METKNKIRLALNENTKGCSPNVLKKLKETTSTDLSFYPEYDELIAKIANSCGVRPKNVLPTNGADEAIKNIAEAYISLGDEVLLPVPTFSIFEYCCKLKGARIKKIKYNEDLSFPTKRVLSAITPQTRMLIIVNPNNPTGTTIKPDELMKILEKTATRTLVVLDEAYSHFSNQTYLHLITKFSNLFIIQTFSKAFGLAGIRLGYIVSNSRNIRSLSKVILPYSVNSIAVTAGIAALEDLKYVARVVRDVDDNKRYLKKEIEKLGVKVLASDTNFILAYFGVYYNFVYRKLEENSILVKNVSHFPLLKGYLRITIGTKEENKTLVNMLQRLLPIEGLLFDLDGVLIDVSQSYRLAIKRTAEYFSNEEIKLEEIQAFKNKGGYNNDWELTYALILKRGIKINKQKVIDKFQEYYLGDNFDGLAKNENWLLKSEVLEKMSLKYKLGIVTGRPRMEVEYAIERFQVKEFFQVIISMDDIPQEEQKPSPYGLKMAMEKLSIKKAVYVGDTVDDMKAAKGAGVMAIYVLPTIVDKELKRVIKTYDIDWILGDINEIEKLHR